MPPIENTNRISMMARHHCAAFNMSPEFSGRALLRCIVWASLLLFNAGCLTPQTTRVPSLVNKPIEVERREAQVQDPFPDSKFGPDLGVRPLEYQNQRAEPLRAKDRYFTALFKRTRVTRMPTPAETGANRPMPPTVFVPTMPTTVAPVYYR